MLGVQEVLESDARSAGGAGKRCSECRRCRKAMLGVWDNRYVLGFAPALRFLQSQIMRRLYKSPSEETITRGAPCA